MANNKSSTKTSSSGGSTSNSSTSTQGGSTTNTSSHSVTNSNSHTEGGSHSYSYGKSWASGKVDEYTQAQRDKYNQDYVAGDKVTAAYDKLQEIINGKPTFQSSYEEQLKGLYDQIMNRDPFSYDFNADSMYQMYKDNYTQQGRTAMQDTMGQAASMTGGYASSYGQSVGQQTYQNYLQQLNDVIPELRDQAYQQYRDEGDTLMDKYGITTDAYDREYGQYRDDVSDWQADRSFQQSAYQDERDFDYSQFTDNRNYWNTEYWNEKNAERSNYQITDTSYWEDTQSRSETNSQSTSNTSFWENSNTHSSSSNWNNSTSDTSYSGGGSSGSSASQSSQKAAQDFYNNNQSNTFNNSSNDSGNSWNNSLNVAPYNITEGDYLASASDNDIEEMVEALQEAQSDMDKAMLKYKMQKDLGITDAEMKLLDELASGKRAWNGNQINW